MKNPFEYIYSLGMASSMTQSYTLFLRQIFERQSPKYVEYEIAFP